MDPSNLLWVCRISGHCFDNMLSPEEVDSDAVSESFAELTLFFFLTTIVK